MRHNYPSLSRLLLIALFLVADVILGAYWLRQLDHQKLIPLNNFLVEIHPALSETILGKVLTESLPVQPQVQQELTPEAIFEALNKERVARKLPEMELTPVLSQGGEEIIKALEKNNYDFNGVDASKILATFLQQKKVENTALFHDTLIGPSSLEQLMHYWNEDQQHTETLASPDITQIGIATASAMIGDQNQGVVVTIYGRPQPVQKQVTPSKTSQAKIVFPEITDSSILQALNSYRADHKVHQLIEHPKLCEYAQKRVGDLLAYGGLDGHEGFKKDFANSENIPQSIKEYPGGAIGENLAYQNCKNMTTGDSFVAQNATSLIEWCFDSSTKGHREAQLNPRYNSVCARHKNGYFVIIFGE